MVKVSSILLVTLLATATSVSAEQSMLQSQVRLRVRGAQILSGEQAVAISELTSSKGSPSPMPTPTPTPTSPTLAALTATVEAEFKTLEASEHTPKFTSLQGPNGPLTPAEMATSIATSVYNAANPALASPEGDTPSAGWDYALNYFSQAERDSCSITAIAAGLSTKDPTAFVKTLAKLYWKGEVPEPSSGSTVAIRDYVFSLNPSDDESCTGTVNCMQGAEFMWTTSNRDIRNQVILQTQPDLKVSYTEVSAKKAADRGLADGSVFFAGPSDEEFWCNQYVAKGGKECTQMQGSCKVGDTACIGFLDNLLPEELSDLKQWVGNGNNAKILFGPGDVKDLTPYAGVFNSVESLTTNPKIKELIGKSYTPLSKTELEVGCESSAFICIADGTFQGACGDGTFGCGPTPGAMCSNLGQSPCVCNHWVLLRKCTDTVASVWSWGVEYPVEKGLLASMTTTIISLV